MKELYDSVIRHLKAQRGHEKTIELWDEIWSKYEKDGGEGLEEFLEEMCEQPEEDVS